MFFGMRPWLMAALTPAIAVGLATGQDHDSPKSSVATIQEKLESTDAATWKAVRLGDATNANVTFIKGQGDNTLATWANAQDTWAWKLHKESDDLGAALAIVEPSLRSQLALPEGQGLVVVEVAENGRAARVGLKPNDILLILDDKPLAKPEDVLETLKLRAIQGGKPVELKILRAGKPTSVRVKGDLRAALAPAAEEKPDFFIGTPANPLDATYRAHLDVPEGTGLIVGEIAEGTPAAKGGVKQGDILLSFDGQALPDVESLRSKIQAKGSKPIQIVVLRGGKTQGLTVTPEQRKAEPTTAATGAYGIEFINPVNVLNSSAPAPFQAVPMLNRLFVAGQNQANGGVVDLQPYVTAGQPLTTTDLNKKIDDLTAQVNALTKAIDALRAAQSEKK